MDPRRDALSDLLHTFCPNVYFQADENVQMKYPAIMYERDRREVQHADNRPYRSTKRYQVTIIDPNPDSDIPDMIAALPLCLFDRFFVADNLNHDVYNLYF